jgi:undecaprenyl-diphosphatase
VLNLRGANQDATWYQEEVENASRLGILHMDVSLSAGTALDTEQMEGLLQMIRKAPKPLLIHCTDGADRSGLLSALSVLDSGQTAGQAQQHLSIRFGHFPYLWWSYTQAMDQSLAQYIRSKP